MSFFQHIPLIFVQGLEIEKLIAEHLASRAKMNREILSLFASDEDFDVVEQSHGRCARKTIVILPPKEIVTSMRSNLCEIALTNNDQAAVCDRRALRKIKKHNRTLPPPQSKRQTRGQMKRSQPKQARNNRW